MPNALALDLPAQKLYWSDARLDKIERADLDGKHRVVLSKVSPQHPFDIAVYGHYIFWTDWVLHAVLRANKYTGEDVVWLRKEVPRPMGIATIHNASHDCNADPCRSLNGGCEDLCRLDEYGKVGSITTTSSHLIALSFTLSFSRSCASVFLGEHLFFRIPVDVLVKTPTAPSRSFNAVVDFAYRFTSPAMALRNALTFQMSCLPTAPSGNAYRSTFNV